MFCHAALFALSPLSQRLSRLCPRKELLQGRRLLYVSPTALIKQIEQLEEGIGTTLFERTPRGLVLTRSGSVLQSKAQNFVQHGDALLADVRTAADSRDSTSALRTSFPGDTSSSCGIGYKNDWQRQHPAFDRFLMSTTVGAPIKS